MKKMWLRLCAAALIGCLVLCGLALGEEVSVDRETLRLVQQTLNEAGYNCGTADGLFGWRTILGIQNYEKANGMTVTGQITTELLEALGIEWPVEEEPEEEPAEEPAEEPVDEPEEEPAEEPEDVPAEEPAEEPAGNPIEPGDADELADTAVKEKDEAPIVATYSTTQDFVDLLNSTGRVYSLRGLDDNNDDTVALVVDGKNATYSFRYFFREDLQHTDIRVWYVISFDEKDLADVMRVCNSLNASYKYAKFLVDESDNTVTASMDLIYRTEDMGDVVWEATTKLALILDAGYEQLAAYNR